MYTMYVCILIQAGGLKIVDRKKHIFKLAQVCFKYELIYRTRST